MPPDLLDGRIVIIGASLAGLRAAETLREEGFAGSLTVIGEERRPPYDRPPLSKQVLLGRVAADMTGLPQRREVDADWKLGVRATGLDLLGKRVLLGDGAEVPFDRVLIATGTRARPWPNPAEAALDGVFSLRTSEDAACLAERLDAGPRRVLVIGAGFTGSEVASACRERGLEVTVAERGPAPLVGALGGNARRSSPPGCNARTGSTYAAACTVTALEGDGRLTGARFSDGTRVDADVAVVALGAVRNTEWLAESGSPPGPRGVACDAGCRAFTMYGIVTDDVFVAGDVARFPHPLFEYQLLVAGALGQRGRAGRGGGAQHGQPGVAPDGRTSRCRRSGRASSASTSSRWACRPSPTRWSSPRARCGRPVWSPSTAIAAASRRP